MASAEDADNVSLKRKREDGENNGDVGVKGDNLETDIRVSCLDQPLDSDVIHEVIKDSPSSLPANYYDRDTTEPISCGLQTLAELLSWKRSDASPFNMAVVPLAPREPPLASSPRRTLVSHDMMGGYLDDRFVQGMNTDAPYAFYHWQYIDIFNYFTHNLVTIPPVVWTNAAHKHGVVILGTFITEWSQGGETCEAFLKGEESYRAVADKLVQITHCYGFDGWLINIENRLSEGAVKNTALFLRYLTDQMHERVPGSLVLWYDSVIESGHLSWQNELNDHNRIFFDACDGFFTNYNWNEQNLEAMKAHSAIEGRQADVYVGVDVFARGQVVGGQFETNKALKIIREHNFSAAIFAPGWVYENYDKKEFRKNQDKFWTLLSDYLYVHRPASPLPFISSLCQGFGKAIYWRGKREAERSWFNLSAQEIQPLYYHLEFENQGWLRSRGCPEDAWNGGSSLLLDGVIPATHTAPVSAKIFSLHVSLAQQTLVILIYKPSAGITASLELKTTDASLCTHLEDVQLTTMTPEVLDKGHQLVSQFYQLCGGLNPEGWAVRCSQLELRGCALREVCFNIQRDGEPQDTPFSCRVGEIMFLDVASLQASPKLISSLCINDVVWLRGTGNSPECTSSCLHLNATLQWKYPIELVHHFKVYWRRLRGPDPRIPAGERVLVGRAYSTMFRVTELVVPEAPGLLELLVEPVTKEGFPVPESYWGRSNLSYANDVTQ